MYNCSQLIGVPTNDLLESIRKVTYTLMYYKTLITEALTDMERNMLVHMYAEDTYIRSSLIKVYTALTGSTPLFPPINNTAKGSYLDGIEEVHNPTTKLPGILNLCGRIEAGTIPGYR
ncbi:MAG: hypothetical protein N2645_12720 [Clostridia bacterium]|nr:hypothetical protein [Clostridia bacterium]